VAASTNPGRARRAYLNTGKHHELLLETAASGTEPPDLRRLIKGGTLEALIHEMIFTTQLDPLIPSTNWVSHSTDDSMRDEAHYRDFVNVVIMAYPSIGTADKFFDQLRVYHELAATACGDDVARLDNRIKVIVEAIAGGYSADCTVSGKNNHVSDKLEAFITTALSVTRSGSTKVAIERLRQGHKADEAVSPTTARYLTSDALLKATHGTSPSVLAATLAMLHANSIKAINANVWRLVSDRALGLSDPQKESPLRTLAFGYREAHFLSRLIISDLLQVDFTETPTSPSTTATKSTSAAMSRQNQHIGSRLTFWIAVAKSAKSLGDTASVVAVILGLSVPAVMRLTDAWDHVSLEDRSHFSGLVDLLRGHHCLQDGESMISPFSLDHGLPVGKGIPFCGSMLESINASAVPPTPPGPAKPISTNLDAWWSLANAVKPSMMLLSASCPETAADYDADLLNCLTELSRSDARPLMCVWIEMISERCRLVDLVCFCHTAPFTCTLCHFDCKAHKLQMSMMDNGAWKIPSCRLPLTSWSRFRSFGCKTQVPVIQQ
jgi:hypothetical protein